MRVIILPYADILTEAYRAVSMIAKGCIMA